MEERNIRSVSVGVVCVASAQLLTQCLSSLQGQRGAPHFDVAVVCDPAIANVDAVRRQFLDVRIVINDGQHTPLQLVSRVLRECAGELILLTKDQCVPGPDWVRAMVEAQAPGRAVVGGRVELASDASATDWAFYFIDFHRYAAPVTGGVAPSLTVCNVSYRRSRLDTIRELWQETFVETTINDALAARFGRLWLHPGPEVTLHRHLPLRDAIVERYTLGRLFGYSRLATSTPRQRFFYAAFAPALPLVLLGRMLGTALRSRRHAAAFVRSFIPLTLMVLGRSWGEWLAYVTGAPPRRATLSHRRPD
ncbi:MAG: glycosyltransferase [Vicinamibacterales bacterium]